MISSKTDSELGRELMTVRGFQWIYGVAADPYGLLLRAESDDPLLLGRQVRDHGALYRSSAGAWVTAGHDLGTRALHDPRLGLRAPDPDERDDERASYAWQIPSLDDVFPMDDAYLTLDRAAYDRLAGLVEPAVAAHADAAPGIHRGRLGRLGAEFDLVADYARPATVSAVATLLGLPADRHERFADLCAGAATALDATLCPPRLKTARTLITSIDGIRTLAAELAENPAAGSLPGALVDAAPDRETGIRDVTVACVLFAAVAVEVTANLIGNAVSALVDNPQQWDLVRADPALAAGAVEETLRYAPPVRIQKLVARENLDLAGQAVTAGGHVVVLIESANRDPAAYPDADTFVVTREQKPAHLSFTSGLHTTVVAGFARLHARTALPALTDRLPRLRRTQPALRRLRSPVTGSALRATVKTA